MNTPSEGPLPDAPAGFRIVEISREPVELYKILKFEGLTDSGGQARAAVAAGGVSVNGVVETQKRKKIRSGDRIEFDEHKLFIRYSAPPASDPGSITESEPVKAKVRTKAKAKRPAKREKVPQKSSTALVPRTKQP